MSKIQFTGRNDFTSSQLGFLHFCHRKPLSSKAFKSECNFTMKSIEEPFACSALRWAESNPKALNIMEHNFLPQRHKDSVSTVVNLQSKVVSEDLGNSRAPKEHLARKKNRPSQTRKTTIRLCCSLFSSLILS